jgi:hypothetical protein
MSSSTAAVAVAVNASTDGWPSAVTAFEEGRPEVVTPSRQAMRFIDDHESDAVLSVGTQYVDERRLREALRRHEHNAALACRDTSGASRSARLRSVLLTSVQSMPVASGVSV